MSQQFSCGDTLALVSYEYGECDEIEAAAIAAHVASCRSCASELEGLGVTRRHLTAWAPPDAPVGFQFRAEASAAVLRPAAWWQRPVPGWLQAAAAVAIFVGGMSIGGATGTWLADEPAVATVIASPSGVSADELAALEQRLRSDMAEVPSALDATVATRDAQLLDQVRILITESEDRQLRELALRTAEVVRDFDTQRQADLALVENRVGQIEGVTGAGLAEQQQILDLLLRRVNLQ